MTSTESPETTTSVIFRLGLATAGGLFIHLASLPANSTSPASTALNVPILAVLGGLGLFALVSAGVRRPSPDLRWLILAAYILHVIIQALIWVQVARLPDLIPTDVGLNTDMAGTLIRHGQNPYTWNFSGVFDVYRTAQGDSTPLLSGASVSQYSYPALLFLLVVPFQALGLPGVFTLSVLAHIAVLVLTYLATPRRWQPVILLPALAGFDFVNLSLIGTLDIVWILALVAMVAAWRRPTLRAILFGLAVSLKQSPALLAPFLIIRLWKEDERGRAPADIARFVLVSAATFLVFNGPFLLWSPVAWFEGYTDPLRDSLVILSQGGLSNLTQYGILYLTKLYFLLATLSVLGLLVFVYSRHYDRLRHALWLFPGIFMWFSYRTLVTYWLYWSFPMLLTVVTCQPSLHVPDRRTPRRSTLAATFGTVLVLVVAGAILGSPRPKVLVRLQAPIFLSQESGEQLVVDVTNLGTRALTPRFAIQSRSTFSNPLPWYVEHGPLDLSAGETATYSIVSNRADRTFRGWEPVQLIVTDAGGDYAMRGVLTIEPDPAFQWPEMILNADYRTWDEAQGMPMYWLPSNLDSAPLVNQDGRQGIELNARPTADVPSEHSLFTSFLHPGIPFGIWLYPPAGRVSNAYGLDVSDGTNRLWILFGPGPYTGPIPGSVHILQRFVPAGAWTYQEINLASAYAEAGLSLPPLSRTLYRGLDIEARVIRLGLFFTTDPSATGEALFGPILHGNDLPTPQALMAETLNHPAEYYARLGKEYELQRNLGLAFEAYQNALRFAPGETGILTTIERLRRLMAGEPQ